mmetsp:Transcript_87329/g.154810  ORF Transcript_87329/g.154810 Transcript_87329/m.154810 type:complete len:191 (+) Transcript_87329:34-606(+)
MAEAMPSWLQAMQNAGALTAPKSDSGRQSKRRRVSQGSAPSALVSKEQALVKDVFRACDGVLDLGGAELGDAAARLIASQLPQLFDLGLERLHLGGNALSDAGLAALLQALEEVPAPSRLRRLNLRGNRLSDASAEALVHALPALRRLESLDVGQNEFGEAGREAIVAAAALMPKRRTARGQLKTLTLAI